MRAINRFLTVLMLAVCVGGCTSGSSPADTTPPIITLLGDNPQTVEVGDPYVEAGATATDNVDGDLSAAIVIDARNVDTSVPGEYTVTYDVRDAAGNSAATVTRRVLCVDTTPPVITLLGDNPQSMWQGDAYTELGATASDNVDGDITAAIVIDATAVDVSTAGEYTVTYDVSDAAGNAAATATRTVRVEVPILSDNAQLADLTISAGDFDQIFQSGLTDYTATVSMLRSTTTVTATTEDANASLAVEGVAVLSGVASPAISLVEGVNTIDIVVTAEDGATTNRYTVDVTRESVAVFAQQAYVKASNTGASDQFGIAVAFVGNTLAIGADGEDGGAGAVYILSHDPAGLWTQQAYVKASNAEPGDRFGWSLSLSGDTLAVAAPGESSSATGVNGDQGNNDARRSGAVYIFTRDGMGTWSQQAYIKASNTEDLDPRTGMGEDFGRSISLSGDTLVVGAPNEDSAATGIDGDQGDNSADDSGAVYVFVRDAGAWSQQAYVKASNTGEFDWFGSAVAVDGETMAVGAWGEASNATGIDGDPSNDDDKNTGAVYLFTRDAGTWSHAAYVKASNARFEGQFGWSLAMADDTLAVGATGTGTGGAAYIFVRDAGDAWFEQSMLEAANADSRDEFGWSIAVSSDALLVGAIREDSSAVGIEGDTSDNTSDDAGAAYLFTRNADGVWTQNAYIKASNTDEGDWFGRSVAIGQYGIAVGASNEDSAATGIDGDQSDNSADSAGAVYVFQ